MECEKKRFTKSKTVHRITVFTNSTERNFEVIYIDEFKFS